MRIVEYGLIVILFVCHPSILALDEASCYVIDVCVYTQLLNCCCVRFVAAVHLTVPVRNRAHDTTRS